MTTSIPAREIVFVYRTGISLAELCEIECETLFSANYNNNNNKNLSTDPINHLVSTNNNISFNTNTNSSNFIYKIRSLYIPESKQIQAFQLYELLAQIAVHIMSDVQINIYLKLSQEDWSSN